PGDRDDVSDAGNDPAEPVGPAREEPGPGTQQVRCKVAEGFIVQVAQEQLAHGGNDEEEHEADDHVHENDGGTSCRNGLSRAHEQARANCTAYRDQLDVAVTELPLEGG